MRVQTQARARTLAMHALERARTHVVCLCAVLVGTRASACVRAPPRMKRMQLCSPDGLPKQPSKRERTRACTPTFQPQTLQSSASSLPSEVGGRLRKRKHGKTVSQRDCLDGHAKMDTLGIEPRASRMLSGCDTTIPRALWKDPICS